MANYYTRRDYDTSPFILSGTAAYARDSDSIGKDVARQSPILQYSLLAYSAVSRKWFTFTNGEATGGYGVPRGIYLGPDIPAEEIVAADVPANSILVGGGAIVDREKVVFEPGITFNTLVFPNELGEDHVLGALMDRGIYPVFAQPNSYYESPNPGE